MASYFFNPCDRVKPPKLERKESRYLDEIQTAELFEKLAGEPLKFRTIITLLIYSGMRKAELCGLYWDDIDMENKVIHIRRNLLYLPEKALFEDSTKNTTSERVIKLSDDIFKLLLEYKLEQNRKRAAYGDRWHDSPYVFTQEMGKPIYPDSITTWFRDFIKKNDLPHVTIHGLRHTNASLLITNGINLTTVSKRLGHANTTTTTRIYAHAIKTADEIVAETLQDILNPTGKVKMA